MLNAKAAIVLSVIFLSQGDLARAWPLAHPPAQASHATVQPSRPIRVQPLRPGLALTPTHVLSVQNNHWTAIERTSDSDPLQTLIARPSVTVTPAWAREQGINLNDLPPLFSAKPQPEALTASSPG